MNKPRLLIILNRLAIGGPAFNVISGAAALSNEFEILLLAGAPDADEQAADYLLEQYKGFQFQKINSLKRSVLPGTDWRAYKDITQAIKKFKPQIVHTHGAKPGVLGRLAAYRLQVPVIVHTFHGHVFHSYFSGFTSKIIIRIEQWLAGFSSAIIAISETLKDELANKYNIASANNIKLIRLGIDTTQFCDEDGSKRTSFRNEFNLSNDTIAIGIVGRLVPVKNHRLFIETAAQVLKVKESNHKLQFFIVGDGTGRTSLQQLISSKQLKFAHAGSAEEGNAHFIFTSWRKDMDAVYAGLDIIMLTSLNEGTPVSIMEAMAAGKPVLSTNVGGISELISSGETGLLASTEHELVAGLSSLIANAWLREQLSAAAAKDAARFSKSAELAALSSLYHSLPGSA
ncbi:glycosyltransferase [Lacibacter sediminis]|uniref:Glycosyltransferase n=1 Tax=Lacibacter sediminis TaxID=2760713 RepID=A0A7G5XHR8_9BACT|nr:glycosyltransferase [Lacibacter sediminis]QNA45021.1 glycosyltransferase [Lacibacter sediminis]